MTEGIANTKEKTELLEIMPTVLEHLRESGNLNTYAKWCHLISENKFPMDNICFLLFLDIVEWFSKSSTSEMRYVRPETKRFWEVGYRLFKGKFLRFMSGPRNYGQIVDGTMEKGYCSSNNSLINFAIPSLKTLCKDKLTPIMPGILHDSITTFADTLPSKFIKIGVDGKKIARGKGKLMGDIDCWDFEPEPTLRNRKERHTKEKQVISDLFDFVNKFDENGSTVIPEYHKDVINQTLISIICLISKRIEDLRNINVRLELGIEKFINLGDCISKHWTKSKFAPVISSLKVAKYDTDSCIADALRFINDISEVCATFNGKKHLYSCTGIVDLTEQENYYQLKSKNMSSEDSRHVIQKSDKWFEIRSEAMVTGSTCNTALGLSQLKQQQAHFDKVVLGKVNSTNFTEQQQANMAYGSAHEIDGVATIVGRVLPAVFPDIEYFEEGCVRVQNKTKPSFMVVSPDGSFQKSPGSNPVMMYENKCKVKSKYTTPVFYKIPKYYIPQLLCEMHAYNCDNLLFSCWSKQSTTVFKVTFDEDLWQIIWSHLDEIYGPDQPKRPTKFHENIITIRSQIDDFGVSNVVLIGEFPSCAVKAEPVEIEYDHNDPHVVNSHVDSDESNDEVTTNVLLRVIHGLQKWLDEVYKLCRTSATEILMFMANDLDRKFHMEINNAHPIAYALKGSSMTNDTFRLMINQVINECEEKGLVVIATSSDGQWHKYGVRNSKDLPLTVYQLQKDMWKEQKSVSKSSLLKEMRNRYKVSSLQDVMMEKNENGVLMVSGHKRDKPLRVFSESILRWQTKTDTPDKSEGTNNSNTNETEQSDVVCDTISFLESFDTHYVIEEDDIYAVTTKNTTNEHGTLIDQPIGEYMQLMFEDVEIENCNTLETEQMNTASNESTGVNETNISSTLFETYQNGNTSAQDNNVTDNETMLSNVLGCAFATICENSEFVEDVGVVAGDNEMQPLRGYDQPHPEECNTATSGNQSRLNESILCQETSNTIDRRVHTLAYQDYHQILTNLQLVNNNRKPFWDSSTVTQLIDLLNDKEKSFKIFTKKEIMVCLDTLKERRNSNISYFMSWNKTRLNNALSNAMTNETGQTSNGIDIESKKRRYNPQKLFKIISKYMNKIPKETLATTMCENKWPNYFKKWSNQSDIPSNDALSESEKSEWFSQPNVNDHGSVSFHFNDACHILTCLRTKICTSGISGLNKSAWEKAAECSDTQLNIAIVKECIDKQSVAFEKRVFAEDVELFMTNKGYDTEARFVHLIGRWFEAEDDPGISSLDRCVRRLELRDYLLDNVNFGSFPPKTQYVKGIPIVTYESLLVHIERKLQIVMFLPRRCYNPRALGTQEVEEFFSTLRDLDPSGLGTPKPDDIPDMMATACFLDNTRMNPNRSFFMKTSRAPVYPDYNMNITPAADDSDTTPTGNKFNIRDHFFDTEDRKRGKQKRKSGILSFPDQPAHGQRGVRQYHACDESKVLSHYRKGLPNLD